MSGKKPAKTGVNRASAKGGSLGVECRSSLNIKASGLKINNHSGNMNPCE